MSVINEVNIKLAVAEDHPVLREGIINLIHTSKNIRVIIECSNGIELLASFNQLTMLPDIAIIDVDMPEMDGYTTAKEIYRNYPSVKTIALSFHSNEFNIIKMIKSGAVGYMIKGSTSFNDMVTAIETVYTNGHYYSDAVPEHLFEKAKKTKLPEFTINEIQFLSLCCQGLSDKEIAGKMFISTRSVEYYFKSVSSKLNLSKRIAIVAYVLKTGIILM